MNDIDFEGIKEKILTRAKEGWTFWEILSELEMCIDELVGMAQKDEDFKKAIEMADIHIRAWCDNKGRVCLENQRFNADLWEEQYYKLQFHPPFDIDNKGEIDD